MNRKRLTRRAVLVGLVLAVLLVHLNGCALTAYNHFIDRAEAAQVDLYSPSMEARIRAAQPGVPR